MGNQVGEEHPQQAQSIQAASFKIVVHDVIENGLNGRIELVVKSIHTAEDGSTQEGPLKVYGIDADALDKAHGGSVDSYLQWVKREHSQHSILRTSVSEKLRTLKGKTL